jgi:hypothetical protein
MVYQWAPGSRVKADPQRSGSYLESLRRRKGGVLTPPLIVEDARASAACPFRPIFLFEDDRTAAEKYRVTQANYVLRSLVMVTSEEGEEERTVRAFVSVIEDEAQVYTAVVRAMKDADLRNYVLAEAKKEFEELRAKYFHLKEFAKVFSALDEVPV